jgi:von Willebrand factor type A domain
MKQAMERIQARFERELQKRPQDTASVLFLLSDGAPTDGNPYPVAEVMISKGVTIVSCFITNLDIADPRKLFAEPESHWSKEARLMFDMASNIEDGSDFAQFLMKKGWTISPQGKLFVQLNHSDILEEFISVVLSPLDNPVVSPRGE